MDNEVRDPVLWEGRTGCPPKPLCVGVVIAEQGFRKPAIGPRAGHQDSGADLFALDGQELFGVRPQEDRRPSPAEFPAPTVTEPDGGQHFYGGGIRAGVAYLNLPEEILWAVFGPSYGHSKVPVAVEDPCVDEFVLRLLAVAPSILRNQIFTWERSLRVVVAPLHPARRRRCVEVPPTFLDILAVVALRVGEPKGPFLQGRVVPVPEG